MKEETNNFYSIGWFINFSNIVTGQSFFRHREKNLITIKANAKLHK